MTEAYPRAKTLLVITVVIVTLAVIWVVYYLQRAKMVADQPASTSVTEITLTPTAAPSTAAATSASGIKAEMASTNVDDVKSTLSGLKASMSMFNR